jgi:hypothetical protein
MSFTVQQFQANVRELARQYQFELEVVFPVIIGSSNLINMLIFSSTQPGRKIDPTGDLAFMGMEYKLASNITYPQWTGNFRIDDNYDLLKSWRAWQELVHGTATNISAFPAQYKSNINLYRLDNGGNRIIQITLNGAWPTNLTVTGLDTKTREPIQADVTIQYDNNTLTVL